MIDAVSKVLSGQELSNCLPVSPAEGGGCNRYEVVFRTARERQVRYSIMQACVPQVTIWGHVL